MGQIKEDDQDTVAQLDVLDKHHQQLASQHEADAKKNEETQKYLNDLLQAIDEMKGQDKQDIDELIEMKGQLEGDVQAASGDLEVLTKDTKDLNDYISDKSGHTYDSENSSVANKHRAIRAFLLQTLKNENEENRPTLKESEVLRSKVQALRNNVRNKFLNEEGATDEEINDLLRQYEDLLDQHAEVFKQLDQEANDNVDEFDKNGDLWKKLFTEGMDLEKRCDDVDYEIEGLADKEGQLKKLRDALLSNYDDYLGKFRYITEQQKGIIDELRGDIDSLRSEIDALRRQTSQAESELSSQSKAYANGRNTQNDTDLENCMNDFVAVHKERRRVQDDGENFYDEWLQANKDFIDRGHSEYGVGQRDKGTYMRIQELLEQIYQSNEDIERLMVDLQKIQKEKEINDHRNVLCNDMLADFSDVRSRLDYELAQRERMLSELREYSTGDTREQLDSLITEIQELRAFLRDRWNEQQGELEELRIEIDSHRERLKTVINEINELRVLIIDEEHHNDIKRNLLRNRDEYIERLKIAIAELEKKPAPKIEYVPVVGDDIDALLAEALRKYGCNVPLTRLGGGFYLFGTRKIFAKIMNGRLVVRVGGGYMVIDEFLASYADMEIIRVNKMLENEGVDAYEELKVYKKYQAENPEAFKKVDPRKRTLIKSPKSKPKPSERGRFS
jgi:chromosome segregation ATPase